MPAAIDFFGKGGKRASALIAPLAGSDMEAANFPGDGLVVS
ncbi:hypothetical protein [Bauldia litoralis]